jgi:arabinofuranan 3-O-arabinosyltransferase
MPHRLTRESWTLVALAALLTAVVLANSWGVLTPDTKPEVFLSPWQTAMRFAAPWQDTPSLGAPNYNVGVAPVAALLGVIESVGLPPWLAMRVWRLLLLVLAAWGARRLYVSLVRGSTADRAAGRVAASVAFVANPYVLVGGATTPTLLPYALLPWFALACLRAFRQPSWRWSAAAALALAAMSGLNAGVVTILQLVVVVPLAVHAVWVERTRWQDVAAVLLRVGLITVVLSLYWVVPAVSAVRVGSAIASTTETLDAINVASSYPEVLRGLGFWPLYGSGSKGAFLPGDTAYLLNALVVALSFGGLLAAALGARLSRSPARVFAAVSLVTGAVVMVGSFPYADPTPWGKALRGFFDSVPGAIAFRTTNKAGAVLELGLCILVGLASAELSRRVRVPRARVGLVLVAAAVVAGSVAPALSGGLYPVELRLPQYWKTAAANINSGADQSRVLTVPGTNLANYQWGYSGPDELGSSLFHRPSTFRSTTPSGSPFAANLMGGVDQRLQEGTLPAGSVSALARYLGAGDVLGRYDLDFGAPVGQVVDTQLSTDPGLGAPQGFGPSAAASGAPNALRLYGVVGSPSSPVVAHPGAGSVLVDGDGTALPELVSAGLLKGDPGLLLAGSLDPKRLKQAVVDGARVVLTDSNGRREWSGQRPDGVGRLLAENADPTPTRALFDAANQTVAVQAGNATIRTSGPGMLFGPFATGDPALAFDGDRTTAWTFGNFGTGVGNAITVSLDRPTDLLHVVLQPTVAGGAQVSSVRVTARGPGGAVTRDAQLGPWATFPTTVDLPDQPATEVTIEVTGVSGSGIGPVGFADISIPGVEIRKAARLPEALTSELAQWQGDDAAAVARARLDVLLHRRLGPADGLAAEEPRLERQFNLPGQRSFTVSGTVRLAQGSSDAEVDAVAGAPDDVRATSSSRAFGRPQFRASAVLDGSTDEPDLDTAWVPGDPVVGEWLQLDFPQRSLSSFELTQSDVGALATQVVVSVDDGTPFPVLLSPGTTKISLPREEQAHRVRILITQRAGDGFVRFTNVSLPRPAGAAGPTACQVVAKLDGQDLQARITGRWSDLVAGRPVSFEACDEEPVRLGAGTHDVASVPTFAVDDLRLRDSRPPRDAGDPPPSLRVRERSATGVTFAVSGACQPCYVSAGQGFDSQWRASVAGRDLGAPLVLDGYAAGWRLVSDGPVTVRVDYPPAAASRWAGYASALGVLLCLALGVRGWITRRRAGKAHG